MTSPRFHIGQFVAVSWSIDDRQVREIGLIVGMVWNCPQLGLGWSYAVNRPGVRPVSQSWFSDAEIIPLLANPVGPPPAPVAPGRRRRDTGKLFRTTTKGVDHG